MSAQSHRDGYLPFWRRFREINLATLERAAGTPLSYATAELICQALFQFHVKASTRRASPIRSCAVTN